MTLTSDEKANLIRYRVNQAIESAELAAVLIEMNKHSAAVNRIYYAIFYCLLALAVKYEFETSKHLQLIGWFNKNFIASGIIESEFGTIARKCYEYRRAADYDAYVVINKENVESLLFQMNLFIDRINKLLN